MRRPAANELRARYGVVAEKMRPFSGSVYDNFAIANSRATFQDIARPRRFDELYGTAEALPERARSDSGAELFRPGKQDRPGSGIQPRSLLSIPDELV